MMTFSGMDISRKRQGGRERKEVTGAGGCDDDGKRREKRLGSSASWDDVTGAQQCGWGGMDTTVDETG